MSDRFEYGRNDYLADQVDYFVDTARFAGTYANSPERLSLLEHARSYDDVWMNLEVWRDISLRYPDFALTGDSVSKYENEDIPVRAYFLGKALATLLGLASAPPHMVSDLDFLLSRFVPKGALKYSEAQRALIENPEASISQVSKIAGLDRSTIHELLRNGKLVRPDSE